MFALSATVACESTRQPAAPDRDRAESKVSFTHTDFVTYLQDVKHFVGRKRFSVLFERSKGRGWNVRERELWLGIVDPTRAEIEMIEAQPPLGIEAIHVRAVKYDNSQLNRFADRIAYPKGHNRIHPWRTINSVGLDKDKVLVAIHPDSKAIRGWILRRVPREAVRIVVRRPWKATMGSPAWN
jgi:hypothetical protein